MSTTLDISPADIRDAIDFLRDLQAQWSYKADSIPRYEREYNLLSGVIERLDKAFQESLPTLADVQVISSAKRRDRGEL